MIGIFLGMLIACFDGTIVGTCGPVIAADLDGSDLYTQELSANGLIVMGNEGNGISPELAAVVNRRLLIPNYPQGEETSESLNVAVATAVVCAEFRRRMR